MYCIVMSKPGYDLYFAGYVYKCESQQYSTEPIWSRDNEKFSLMTFHDRKDAQDEADKHPGALLREVMFRAPVKRV